MFLGMEIKPADVKSLKEIADAMRGLAAKLDAIFVATPAPPLAKIDDSEVATRVAANLCLTCEKKPVSRGLCHACRKEAAKKVNSGDYSEDDLISANMMLPAQRPGRKSESGFARRLPTATELADVLMNPVEVIVKDGDGNVTQHLKNGEDMLSRQQNKPDDAFIAERDALVAEAEQAEKEMERDRERKPRRKKAKKTARKT